MRLTQSAVSKTLAARGLQKGYSPSHLSAVESGDSWPSVDLVNALDSALATGGEFRRLLRYAKVPFSDADVTDDVRVTAHLFFPLRVDRLPASPMAELEPGLGFVPKLTTIEGIDAGSKLHRFPFGVVVLHERHELQMPSLTEVAEWRVGQLARCPSAVEGFLTSHNIDLKTADHSPYCFTAFVLTGVPWAEPEVRRRATHLLAMPSVLLASEDPQSWVESQLNPPVESHARPIEDVVDHSLSGSHLGGASWAAVSLMAAGSPEDLEHTLVEYEVQLQAFWCYTSNLLERAYVDGDDYDPDFLNHAVARFERPWPTESTATRRLREAIFETSRIDRLARSARRIGGATRAPA